MSSYIILVLVVTLIISSVSVYYYSEIYKKNLFEVNQKILSHLNIIIDETMIRDTIMTYVDMSISSKNNREFLNLFNRPLKGNHGDIAPASDYLKYLVASSDGVIESIHVYYKNNDILLSSNYGLMYRNEETLKFDIDHPWLIDFQNGQSGEFWVPKSDQTGSFEYGFNQTFSYIKGFPTLATPDNYKGVICININESAVTDILLAQQNEHEDIHVIDSEGHLIATTLPYSEQESFKISNTYIEDILENPETEDNLTYDLTGSKHIISYNTILTNGWHIVHITSVDDFYKELYRMRVIILLLSIVAIGIGLIITVFLTYKLYNPLRRITRKLTESLITSTDDANHEVSEYSLINRALENLTNQVNSLESTVDDNKPLIKHNIVTGLLYHRIKDEESFDYRLNMLNYSFEHSYFNVVILKFNPDTIGGGNHSLPQTAIYNLIKIFENIHLDDYQFLATELSDYKIGLIMNSEHNQLEIHIAVIEKILENIFIDPAVYPYIYIGSSANKPWSLYRSSTDTEVLQKYQYFLPNQHFIAGETILKRERCIEKLDPALIEQFTKALHLKNMTQIDESLQLIVNEMQNGPYSYDHCNALLINLTSIVSNYIRNLGIESEQIINKTVLIDFKNIDNIILLKQWLLEITKKSFDYLDQRSKNKNYVAIDQAKAYILKHIEDDLSLDIVADEVILSPRYLSKLFKEYTGENFTEFVNSHKMAHAKDLIISTDLTINILSDRLGFSSPAYFIKKFKAAYGSTPNEYRLQHRGNKSE